MFFINTKILLLGDIYIVTLHNYLTLIQIGDSKPGKMLLCFSDICFDEQFDNVISQLYYINCNITI